MLEGGILYNTEFAAAPASLDKQDDAETASGANPSSNAVFCGEENTPPGYSQSDSLPKSDTVENKKKKQKLGKV